MSKFNFFRDVNRTQFEKAWEVLGNEPSELNTQNVSEEFNKLMIGRIIEKVNGKMPLQFSEFSIFGLSEESMGRFLGDPLIVKELEQQGLKIPEPLGAELMAKIQLTYDNGSEKLKLAGVDASGAGTLASLSDIFIFVKNLSEVELSSVEKHYPGLANVYLNGHSLKEFQDDLNKVDKTEPGEQLTPEQKGKRLLAFETKYAGCFNGMLNNVILPMLDNERYIQIIRSAQPTALDKVQGLEVFDQTIHEQVNLFKNKIPELNNLFKSKIPELNNLFKNKYRELKNTDLNGSKSAPDILNNIQQYIETNEFTLGSFAGFKGGIDINLPDGSSKRVPHRVAKMYNTLLDEKQSPETKLAAIKGFAEEGIKNPRSGQAPATTEFYKLVQQDKVPEETSGSSLGMR